MTLIERMRMFLLLDSWSRYADRLTKAESDLPYLQFLADEKYWSWGERRPRRAQPGPGPEKFAMTCLQWHFDGNGAPVEAEDE